MRRRVVITGMGAITPLGLTVDDLYRNQLEGRSGVGPITLFDASTFPTRFAARSRISISATTFAIRSDWANSGANSASPLAAAQQAVEKRRPAGDDAADRPHAHRRLSRLRRRHSGLPAPRVRVSPRVIIRRQRHVDRSALHRPRGSRHSIATGNTSRNCTRRRAISRPISIWKGPITTA